jgi:hypothetical protein
MLASTSWMKSAVLSIPSVKTISVLLTAPVAALGMFSVSKTPALTGVFARNVRGVSSNGCAYDTRLVVAYQKLLPNGRRTITMQIRG